MQEKWFSIIEENPTLTDKEKIQKLREECPEFEREYQEIKQEYQEFLEEQPTIGNDPVYPDGTSFFDIIGSNNEEFAKSDIGKIVIGVLDKSKKENIEIL